MRRKSGNAIREIPFENAGKNTIADFHVTPTDFILRELAGFSHGQAVPEYSYFPKIMSCVPGSFVGRMFLPLKNHIFGKIGSEMVWSKKRDTSKVVGSAYNQQNQVFHNGFGVLHAA